MGFLDFINSQCIEDKINYAKQVLALQNVQEKYFLTFPSFLESLIRVIHLKYRIILKDQENLSVHLGRFFKSLAFKDAKLHISLCY
jgi:hypothetical protein